MNPAVPASLRKAWKRVECLSVAAYLQALTGAVLELKENINATGEAVTTERELLAAFAWAVAEGSKDASYAATACRLLRAEFKDTDAAFLDLEEAENW